MWSSFAFDNLVNLAVNPVVWASLVSLIAMEVVLGIDNLIFISIMTSKLPPGQRDRARRIGIALALILRLLLLTTVAFIVTLTTPVITILTQEFSWRDIILIAGGLFLLWKATKEIYHHVDPNAVPDMFEGRATAAVSFGGTIVQILIIDMVFSVDSIITAVGMTPHVPVMVIAVVVAVLVMLLAEPARQFHQCDPTVVMLALAFLIMIGMTLIAEGFGADVPKGYVYAAMAFATANEGLNMLSRRAAKKRQAAAARTELIS